jgi:TrmH family RNA methyltransferase
MTDGTTTSAHDLVPDAPLSRVVIVLDHPQDVVNIAGVVRLMMNFGLSRLRLVQPDEFDPHRIEGIAHRSTPLVEATTLHDTLGDAVADCTWVLGTTARPRTAGRNYVRPGEAAQAVVKNAARGDVAILFGREDKGLFNDALDLCHAVAIVPTSEYSSLNLAQAALVIAYETFLAAAGPREELPRGRRATRPPTQAELEVTYRGLRQGLHAIEFFKARKPSAIMRTLRTLVARAQPDLREAKLLAAIGFEIGHYIDRLRGDRSGEVMPRDATPESSPDT